MPSMQNPDRSTNGWSPGKLVHLSPSRFGEKYDGEICRLLSEWLIQACPSGSGKLGFGPSASLRLTHSMPAEAGTPTIRAASTAHERYSGQVPKYRLNPLNPDNRTNR